MEQNIDDRLFSCQIYEIIMSYSLSETYNKFYNTQTNSPISNVVKNNDNVRFNIHVTLPNISIDYIACIFPSTKTIILFGPRSGRTPCLRYISEILGRDYKTDIILRNLTPTQSLNIFQKIIDLDKNNNIIYRMVLTFSPTFGYKFDQETYTELAYKFKQNRCASKHRKFTKLTNNSKAIAMHMYLKNCKGLTEEHGKMKIVISPDCSFRVYSYNPLDGWLKFLREVCDLF